MKESYLKGVLLCLVATLAWGAMFPVMTSALRHIDAFSFTALRYSLAACAFVALLLKREGWAALDLRGQRVGLLWLLGSAGFAGFGFLVFLGQKIAGPNGALTASILMATMPLLGLLVNWALRKVRPLAPSFAFIVMSFCGVLLVLSKGDPAAILRSPGDYSANVPIILGALCWVIYTVGASYFPAWSPIRYTTITTLLGLTTIYAVVLVLAWTGLIAPSLDAVGELWPHLLYMAFVAGFVGVLSWNSGNKIITPLNGVLFMDVVPITAFSVSVCLGVIPSPPQILGAAITASALIFNNLYLRARMAQPAALSMPKKGVLWMALLGLCVRPVHAASVSPLCMINTFAGTGSPGTGGDGGPALSAQFNQTAGIGFDLLGDLFITDTGNNRIRKVNPAGIISTVAGTGSYGSSGDGGDALLATLGNPQCVRVGPSGIVYIMDSGNYKVRKVDLAGRLFTVAGTGSAGFSGDGGQAFSANLSQAYGIAVDPAGQFLYIADTFNHRIRRVDLGSGVITTVAGSGSAGFSGDGGSALAAKLNAPYGVFVDGTGNLLIADTFNARIRKVTPAGIISTVAGSGAMGYAGDGGPALSAAMNDPQSVEMDASGSLFISDTGNNVVRQVRSDGSISTLAGSGFSLGDGGPANHAKINGPWDTALDAAGDLFIADRYQYRVRKLSACAIDTATPTLTPTSSPSATISPSSTGTSTASPSASASPTFSASPSITVSSTTSPTPSITQDPTQNLTVLPSTNTSTASPTLTISATFTPSASSTDDPPADATMTATPVVSGSATATPLVFMGAIQGVTGNCLISTVVGNGSSGFSGDGGAATLAQFSQVGGISLDGGGNLYIADTYNNRIRRVSAGGVMSSLAGTGAYGFSGDGGPATSAQFADPQAVAVDAAGNVYVDDTGNNRIRKIGPAGIVSTVAGNGGAGYSGDGGAALSAQINVSNGLALDPAGAVLYIADSSNNRIRRVDLASGIITTVAGNGTAGFSGDGGAATLASLNSPAGVSADGNGNLYIADSNNNRIRRVDPTGVISTLAGSGSSGFSGDGALAIAAALNHPVAMVADGFGSVFIDDLYNNRVRKVTPDGLINTIAGGAFSLGDGGPANASQLNAPSDLALDGSGDLLIADKYQYRIRKITACSSNGTRCDSCVSTSSLRPGAAKAAVQSLQAPLIVAPNPAAHWVQIFWDQDSAGTVSLSIFDIAGMEVWPTAGAQGLLTGESAGVHSLRVDISHLANGIYIVREAVLAPGQTAHLAKLAVLR